MGAKGTKEEGNQCRGKRVQRRRKWRFGCVKDFGAQNFKAIQRIHKAWETPLRKDQELRGIRNGIIGGYHEWLKVRI